MAAMPTVINTLNNNINTLDTYRDIASFFTLLYLGLRAQLAKLGYYTNPSHSSKEASGKTGGLFVWCGTKPHKIVAKTKAPTRDRSKAARWGYLLR